MSTKNFERAMVLAAEYNKENARGNTANAGEIRRTLEELNIGSYINGKYTLPAQVLEVMGVAT